MAMNASSGFSARGRRRVRRDRRASAAKEKGESTGATDGLTPLHSERERESMGCSELLHLATKQAT